MRDENERHEARHAAASSGFAEYRCECGARSCDLLLSLTVDEYAEVRSDPAHRLVARGHMDPRVEFALRQTARYQVVQRFGVAAKVAAPRGRNLRERQLSEIGSVSRYGLA